jgi:hypothetical protein
MEGKLMANFSNLNGVINKTLDDVKKGIKHTYSTSVDYDDSDDASFSGNNIEGKYLFFIKQWVATHDDDVNIDLSTDNDDNILKGFNAKHGEKGHNREQSTGIYYLETPKGGETKWKINIHTDGSTKFTGTVYLTIIRIGDV